MQGLFEAQMRRLSQEVANAAKASLNMTQS
jgi:hypothetical protein